MSGGRERSEDGSAKAPPRLRALQIYLCGTEQEPCVMCGLFPSEYTIYVIMVLWEGVEWQIRKRYSEFRYLHDFLLSKFGNRLGAPACTFLRAHIPPCSPCTSHGFIHACPQFLAFQPFPARATIPSRTKRLASLRHERANLRCGCSRCACTRRSLQTLALSTGWKCLKR
jgi:hypothetical protein